METTTRIPILCVDDEPHILEALTRLLRRDYVVSTAPGGAAALETLERAGPFAVVVSDMRMPGMDGATFLRQARERAPDTTRVLLTGQADFSAAIAAVNEGNIFRFLTKPCPPNVLISTLQAAAEQYRLVSTERVLLERTLHGCVKALTDVLALTNPVAFGRGLRAKQLASELVTHFAYPDRWQVEVAAMLSQIGSITLPPETVEKLYDGDDLTDDEAALVNRLPAVARQLFGEIPRLEPVVSILVYQGKQYDGRGVPFDGVRGDGIPWGARALKIVLDFDVLETQLGNVILAVETLRGRDGWYDPVILDAFAILRSVPPSNTLVREITLREVRPGMIFATDVRTRNGRMLIGRGQEVSESLADRLQHLPRATDVIEPLRVIVKVPN